MSYRVIQWATGEVGKEALRHIVGRRDLELVGVYVYSDAKNGVDAGEIAGVDPVGVTATTDRDAILAMDADCVIHSPSMFLGGEDLVPANDADVEALLRSGKNVASTAGYVSPSTRGAAVEQRFADACAAGGSTLFGTGVNPGFWLERIGPMLTGLCQRVDHLAVEETWDATDYPSPEIMTWLGFGQPGEAMTPDWPAMVQIGAWFHETLSVAAHGLGAEIERFERSNRYGLATRDLHLSGGLIKEGTVAAIVQTWTGIVDGKPLVSMTDRWIADWDHPEYGGDDRSHHWIVSIEGAPSISARFDFDSTYPPIPGAGAQDRLVQGTTSAAAVNPVPLVCAAPPGVLRPPTFAPCLA